MPIRSSARYLGALLGPPVCLRDRWTAPLTSFNDRLRQLAASRLAPSLTTRIFSFRVAPLLDYSMSMLGEPPAVDRLNATVAECLWRMPHESLLEAALGPLRQLGWPLPPDLGARARRAARAAAVRIKDTIDESEKPIDEARGECGSLASMADGAPYAEHEIWADEAVMDKMRRAVNAEEDAPVRREAARAVARARRDRRRGLPPEAGPVHAEAAEALLPRLLRWAALTGLGRDQLREAAMRALAALVGCSPAAQIAVVHVWTDGVAT